MPVQSRSSPPSFAVVEGAGIFHRSFTAGDAGSIPVYGAKFTAGSSRDEDAALSRLKHGFESRTRYQEMI